MAGTLSYLDLQKIKETPFKRHDNHKDFSFAPELKDRIEKAKCKKGTYGTPKQTTLENDF